MWLVCLQLIDKVLEREQRKILAYHHITLWQFINNHLLDYLFHTSQFISHVRETHCKITKYLREIKTPFDQKTNFQSTNPIKTRINGTFCIYPSPILDKKRPSDNISNGPYLGRVNDQLVDLDILVYVLRANQCVEEQEAKTCNDNPVADKEVACKVYNTVLQEWKNTTTANHCHKDT